MTGGNLTSDALHLNLSLHPTVAIDAEDRFEKICEDPFALLATAITDRTSLDGVSRSPYFYLAGLPGARRKSGAKGANVFTKALLTDAATKIIKSRPKWLALADEASEWEASKNSISEIGNGKYAALANEKGIRPITYFQILRICAAHEAVAESLLKGANRKVDKKALLKKKREIYASLAAIPAVYTVNNLGAIKKELEAKAPRIEEIISLEFGQTYDRDTIFQSYWPDKRFKKYLKQKPKRKEEGKAPEVVFILTGMVQEFGVTLATAQRLSNAIKALQAANIVKSFGGEVKEMVPNMLGQGEAYRYEMIDFNAHLKPNLALGSIDISKIVPVSGVKTSPPSPGR